MKRHIAAALSIFAVVAGVGWKLASHPETSAALQDISLVQRSEHSRPASTNALAGNRVRLSPNDLGNEITVTALKVPQISLAAE